MDGPKKRIKFFRKYYSQPYSYLNNRQLDINNNKIKDIEKIINLNQNKYKITYQNIDNFNDQLSIKFIQKITQNTINCQKYLKKEGIPGLPYTIVDIICKLLNREYFIEVIINLQYTNKYPFDPPIWSLNKILTNTFTGYNLTNIFKYWIDVHNEIYQKQWSSVTTIDKDILNFMIRVQFCHQLVSIE